MKQHPILFSSPMVRAILEGKKHQTRRVLKIPDKVAKVSSVGWTSFTPERHVSVRGDHVSGEWGESFARVPYAVGDRLWVRETWKYAGWTEDGEPFIGYAADGSFALQDYPEEWHERVLDQWITLSDPVNYAIDNKAADRTWRPSIHMPRWACRLKLVVTAVRVERLNSISEEDACAEGVGRIELSPPPLLYTDPNLGPMYGHPATSTHVHAFKVLWDGLNAKRGYSWESNPYVLVISFEKVPQ